MKFRSLLLACLLTAPALAQVPAERVTDINTTQTGPAAFYGFWGWDLYLHEMAAFGTRVAFTAEDGIHGHELWITDGSPAGTQRLTDLCPGRCSAQPRLLRAFEDRLFFLADDGVHGGEPYVTDGTAAGTLALGDLWPGHGTSRVIQAIASSTQVFFVPDTPGRGRELWRTDGTAEGTRLVRELRPGPESTPIRFLGAVGGALLFALPSDGGSEELWRSDGTSGGTQPLGVPGFGPQLNTFQAPVPVAGLLFFLNFTATSGTQVWRTDGTVEGTFAVTTFSSGSASPAHLASWNGRAYFLVDSDSTAELWSSEGSVAGTVRVASLPPEAWFSFLNPGPNGLYFQECAVAIGCEPWFSDGTAGGTRRIRDLRPGPESGLAAFRPWLGPAGSGFVFLADDGVHGIEPWFSDGTDAGTRRLVDAMPGPESSHGLWDAYRGFERAHLGGRIFFWAAAPGLGFEPWSSDGTPAGTALLRDVNATAPSIVRLPPEDLIPPLRPTPVPGGLFFLASDHGVDAEHADERSTGIEPWFVSHGSAPPVALGDLAPGPAGSVTTQPVAVPAGAAFLKDGELWRSDGTPAGTQPVAATAGLAFDQLLRLDTKLLVEHRTALEAAALRALDLDLTNLGPPLALNSSSSSQPIHPAGSRAFVGTAGLVVTDGTSDGTRVVEPNLPGYATAHFVALDEQRVLFAAVTPDTGIEPWFFEDGRELALPVADLLAGPESGLFPGFARWESWQLAPLASIGGQALFGANDGIHGFELWASDGTAPGTRLVADLIPGAASSDLERLTPVGSRVYFVADDGVHGREIWVSDGTAPGTRLVRDLAPGPGSAVPQELTAIGDSLVFNAWTPEHGRELWLSDGSEIGTRRLTDVAPGPLSSSPVTFVAAGPWLYFTANDNLTGDELWRLPLAALQPVTIFADGFESGDLSAWRP